MVIRTMQMHVRMLVVGMLSVFGVTVLVLVVLHRTSGLVVSGDVRVLVVRVLVVSVLEVTRVPMFVLVALHRTRWFHR